MILSQISVLGGVERIQHNQVGLFRRTEAVVMDYDWHTMGCLRFGDQFNCKMHSDGRSAQHGQQQRHLIKAIQRLPRWDSTEDSLDKGAYRQESLVVHQEGLFARNDRQREMYCEEQSDLQTLNDWIRRDDDLCYTDTSAFAVSQAHQWPSVRVLEAEQLEKVSVSEVDNPRHLGQCSPQKSRAKHIKDSFVENLKEIDILQPPRWEVNDEGSVGEIQQSHQMQSIEWEFPKSEFEYSFDNKGGRSVFRAKKRIFCREEPAVKAGVQPHLPSRQQGVFPYISIGSPGVLQLPVQVVRHQIIVETNNNPNVQPLLDELLVSKQRETALTKLSEFQDELLRSLRVLCRLKLYRAQQIRSEEIATRQHLLRLSEQLSKSQKHLKYCYTGRFIQTQREAEVILKLVAIPLNYSKVLAERQSELEVLIQNILSTTSLQKLIKAESAEKYLRANLSLLQTIQQRESLDAPMCRIEALEDLKEELDIDVRQIQELLEVLPDQETLEQEFSLHREQDIKHVSDCIRKGSYREKELANVLDYLHRRGIVFQI